MNVLLLGKTGSIIRWIEDMADDLRFAGHVVSVVPTRNPSLSKSVERLLLSRAIGAPLAVRVARRARRLAPDLIIAVGGFEHTPRVILEHLSRIARRPPLVAWIGDAFTQRVQTVADMFDLIAYTDTGLLDSHNQFGFRAPGAFVPIAAMRGLRPPLAPTKRIDRLAFVAAPTPNRRDLLANLAEPIAIFGPGWRKENGLDHHQREVRRIGGGELARIYAGHMGILNVRHDRNVVHGLNQRHFAPYVQAAPVITDAQSDIAHCFDPGSEMLVYNDPAELSALYAKMRRQPDWAAEIGRQGQRRVLAHHTYAHRLDAIARIVNVARAGER